MRVTIGLAALCLIGGLACYNPKIEDGTLKCGGPSSTSCPEGMVCSFGFCFSKAAASRFDGGMCVQELYPQCRAEGAQANSCDPVCQRGCGCDQRCDPTATGAMVCGQQAPNQVAGPYERCAANSELEQCQPGTICLAEREERAECGARCYRICRTDAECASPRGDGRCVGVVQFQGGSEASFKTCSPPREQCDPVGESDALNSCRTAYGEHFACRLLSTNVLDDVVCDCKGTLSEGTACGGQKGDCKPGLECVNLASVTTCRRICQLDTALGAPLNGCALGQICQPFAVGSQSSRTYGFCR